MSGIRVFFFFCLFTLTKLQWVSGQGSGIRVPDELKEAYNEVRSGKGHLRYAIYRINPDTHDTLEVEKTGDRNATYEEYLTHFPEDDVRVGIFNMAFKTPSGTSGSKVVAMSWFPNSASGRKRLIWSSTFIAIKTALHINSKESLTVDNMADASYDSVLEKLGLGTRP